VTATLPERDHERVEQLCAAAVRALTGMPELHFRGGALHRGATPVHAPAPHLRTRDRIDDLGSFRGAADGLALRLLHSDTDAHLRARPDDEMGALVFELLEQFRVESLADPQQVGTIANLRHRHEAWSAQFHASGLTETATGLLLYTVAQTGRAKVTGEPVVAATEDLLEATRFGLAPLIGEDLGRLRSLRHDQAAYAETAHRIAETISGLVAAEAANGRTPRDRRRETAGFSLALTEYDPEGDSAGGARSGGYGPGTAATPYAVFTRVFDRETTMSRLTRRAQLLEYRHRLDELVEHAALDVTWLARLLRGLVDTTREVGWNSAQEEGLVDAGRLSRLVTSPSDPRVFRTPRQEPDPELQVTLLLDCSGSMRHHQEHTALMVDILVRALDIAGIDNEVLGFTTAAWNGGRSLRDWRRAGRPASPGRLNERLHLVVKDATTPWRRARTEIAGLLRPDFYREALDGEAVAWAVGRLGTRQDVTRRVLLVLSDGSPMDGATAQANGPSYLDRHLVAVLDGVAARGEVAVTGLGVGADLGRYYSHARVLELENGVDKALMRTLVEVLHEASRRRRSW
jgi:cobaltochelatase CobT